MRLPDKTEYVQRWGSLNMNGSVLKLVYSDGSIAAKTLTLDMVKTYNNSALGETVVTIRYEGFEDTFTVRVIKATVTFLNYDGSHLSSQQYAYGEEVTIPNVPGKPADEVGEYYFAGWSKRVVPCAGNVTYVAVFRLVRKAVSITVSQMPYQLEYVQMNDTLNVAGAQITVAYNDGTSEILPVTVEMVSGFTNQELGTSTVTVTYEEQTATFDVTIIKATVMFVDYDGSVLSQAQYAYGETVVPPEDPSRPTDDSASYVFLGWDKEVVPCEGNTTYTARYEVIDRIVFTGLSVTLPEKTDYVQMVETLDLTGALVHAHYSDGSVITEPITMEMVTGFDHAVLGENTITVTCMDTEVTFTVTIIKATVTFLNYDGTVISQTQYAWGETVTPPEPPVKPAGKNGPYAFTGWDREIEVCNGNATYTAQYELQYACGDSNFDGKVNEDDAIHLLWHVFFPEDYAVDVWADYNGDDVVNEDDAILLMWHVFFPEDHPLTMTPET